MFNYMVEWLAMRNLINYQKDKSIGQLTYELNNEAMDEPIQGNLLDKLVRQKAEFTLKQLCFRKKEIIMKRNLFFAECFFVFVAIVCKGMEIVNAFFHLVL